MAVSFAALVVCVCFAGVLAGTSTISNANPRRDTTGQIVDAHDGKMLYQNGVYYWYAASYGNCREPAGDSGCSGAAFGACGFRGDHNVSLFTSTDLATWTSHGPVFQTKTSGISNAVLFCPKILFNQATKKYVLWFNWISGSDFGSSFYAVAISDSAFGPFTVVSQKVTTLAFTDTGDFNLLQDDDGSAYLIYTAHIQGFPVTHQMSVERLSADYYSTLGSSASSGFFGQSFVEAPAMFKRRGIYYAVFGTCCCYCQEGSPVTVYTAPTALGPYTRRNTIDATREICGSRNETLSSFSSRGLAMGAATRAAASVARSDDDDHVGSNNVRDATVRTKLCNLASGIHAQQTDIFPYISSTGVQYMWMGDRWQSAPDGIKGHDFTYWYPMQFDATGNVTAMKWVDSFTINLP